MLPHILAHTHTHTHTVHSTQCTVYDYNRFIFTHIYENFQYIMTYDSQKQEACK